MFDDASERKYGPKKKCFHVVKRYGWKMIYVREIEKN